MGPREQFDTFLPSGAVGDTRLPHFSQRASDNDRSFSPSYIPQPLHGSHASPPLPKPYSSQPLSYFSPLNAPSPSAGSLSPQQNGPPISPPVSRSASSDGTSSTQVDYWRSHVQKIREQAQGERAHMIADRARAEEVMDEERALWEEERKILLARISELEGQVFALNGHLSPQVRQNALFRSSDGTPQAGLSRTGTPQGVPQRPPPVIEGPVSGSIDGTAAKVVPQESGRMPDGSVLWAPSTRAPSRTFESTENYNLRVDNISIPQETAIRATSRELGPSNFAVVSPPMEENSREGSVVSEPSIDVSQIHPSLEGIPLKASAVAPEFKANIMSPNGNNSSPSGNTSADSSAVVSPPPPRDVTNSQDERPSLSRNGSQSRKASTLEVITAPEKDRRVMNAGHTPNHSITQFDLGSGSITPTQDLHLRNVSQEQPEQYDGNNEIWEDEDPKLTGRLGLTNEPDEDDKFLKTLDKKLEVAAKEKAPRSPSATSVNSDDVVPLTSTEPLPPLSMVPRRDSLMPSADDEDPEDQAIDEIPKLKVKASKNFGRPFGTI